MLSLRVLVFPSFHRSLQVPPYVAPRPPSLVRSSELRSSRHLCCRRHHPSPAASQQLRGGFITKPGGPARLLPAVLEPQLEPRPWVSTHREVAAIPLPADGHSPETREVARAPEATHKGSLWGRGIPDLPCDAPKLSFLGWALWMHKRKRIFFSFPPELKSTVGKHPGSLGTLCISFQTKTPKPYGSSQGSFTLSASVYPFPAAATFPPSTWWVEEIPRGALGVTRRRGSTRRGVPRGWGRGRLPGDERSRAEVSGSQEPWREGPRVVTGLGRCSEVGRIRS